MRGAIGVLAVLATVSLAAGKTFDLLVIGSGSAGLQAAKVAARFGKSVAIIEKAPVFGGDCTWTGCVPSKTLLAAAKRAHVVRTAGAYGISTGAGPAAADIDLPKVKSQLDAVIQRIYDADDAPPALEALGITPVSGMAKFVDRKTLEVTDASGISQLLTARKGTIIATGAAPRPPNIAGLTADDYMTYESVFKLEELPRRLIVVGGGPIGCELAQAFSRLGSTVTLVASQLLPGRDGEPGAVLSAAFVEEGITLAKARATSFARDAATGDKVLTVTDAAGATAEVRGDALLIATGRIATTGSLALERIGVALTPRGGIKVDRLLQTTVRGVYAAGDCTGDQQFTHYAATQGGLAAVNALLSFLGPLRFPGVFKEEVPACTFTSPAVATVGLTEADAVAKYGAAEGVVKAITRPLARVDGAIASGVDAHGYVKLVYKGKDTTLLGATLVAPEAGEMIAEVTVALANRMKLSKMATVMHAYPSLSVAIQQCAAEVYYDSLDPTIKLLDRLGLM